MTVQEVVDNNNKKDRREGKGRVIALSRTIYRIENTDVFYVESESIDGMYYYVMFDTAKDFCWCSCLDNSTRGKKCKHIFAVDYALRQGLVKDTDKLPPAAKRDNSSKVKSAWDDDYGF